MSRIKLLKQVAALLPTLLPQAKILRKRIGVQFGPVQIPLEVNVEIGNTTKILFCDVQAKGEPKYLLNAIGRLSLAIKRSPDAYPIVIVPSLSTEGRNVLSEAGVGWLTLGGEAFLRFPPVFIERMTAPTETSRALLGQIEGIPKRQRRLPFPYSAKASRIIRGLLERPGQICTLTDLASEARINLRLALLAINTLEEKGYVKKERGAIQLLKPKELLEAWAAVYKFQEANQFSYYYSLARNFDELGAKLKSLPQDLRGDYRLTLYAGASLVAPQMRFDEVQLYIKGDPSAWAKRLTLSPVKSGANVILVTPYDAGVFDYAQEKKGLMVASNTQLYLDLVNLNDRAREQAEALFRESISRPEPGTLGGRIKKARIERMGERGQMSRQGLADFVGVSEDKIAAWEENEAVPSNDEFIRLAKWLRKPVQYFQVSKTTP